MKHRQRRSDNGFAKHIIVKLVQYNPRRDGTHGWDSWEVLKPDMTYEQFLKAGGRHVDLAWDVQKNHLLLKPRGDTTRDPKPVDNSAQRATRNLPFGGKAAVPRRTVQQQSEDESHLPLLTHKRFQLRGWHTDWERTSHGTFPRLVGPDGMRYRRAAANERADLRYRMRRKTGFVNRILRFRKMPLIPKLTKKERREKKLLRHAAHQKKTKQQQKKKKHHTHHLP